jgi:predicted anti-sigma-YlaC factor YlaD
VLTCEEIAKLVSESLDRDLSFPERVAVRFHLLYCRACARYRRQVAFLRNAMRAYREQLEREGTGALSTLSPAARERIKQALR